MPKFAANLHYLFTEVAFLDRFAAAARAGFRGVEFQVPYDHPVEVLRARLDAHGLAMVLFDAPMGDWEAGDRGLACIPGRESEFEAGLPRVVEYGRGLGCDTVHVMAGVMRGEMRYKDCEATYVANLRRACDYLAGHCMHVVIEPINARFGDVRGGPDYTTEGMSSYFLNRSDQACRFLEMVQRPNLWLHLDIYHMQLTEGHLSETIRAHIGKVRHFQMAGVPGRHEPDVGEINYPFLFDLLDELGYDGWVGCEYRPRSGTLEGLGWAAKYGIGASPGTAP
jgi:hydroxypyruvate isomerase